MGKSGGKWWGCGGNVVILNDNRSYVPYTRDICRKTRCQRAYSPAFGPAQGAGRRGGRRIFYSPLDAGDVFGDVHVPHVGGGVGQDPAFESLCAGAPRLHPPFYGGGALCGGRCGGAGEYPGRSGCLGAFRTGSGVVSGGEFLRVVGQRPVRTGARPRREFLCRVGRKIDGIRREGR